MLIRERCRRFSTAKFSSRTTERKPISIWDITKDLQTRNFRRRIIGRAGGFIFRSSKKNGAAIILEKRFRLFRTLPTKSKMPSKVVANNEKPDVLIVEIGGTVGDIESLPFMEAIRQIGNEEGRNNAIFVHVTLVPYIAAAGELKTKPTQHSVRELREIGIAPDILLCRSEHTLVIGFAKKDRSVSVMFRKTPSFPRLMCRRFTKFRSPFTNKVWMI